MDGKLEMILQQIAPHIAKLEGKPAKEVYYDGWTDCYGALAKLDNDQNTGREKTA